MPRFRLTIRLAVLLAVTLAVAADAQPPSRADTTRPEAGLDFSGVDEFWKIVDVLTRDVEPTEAQWHALLATPGYRLAEINIGTTMRQDLEVAFMPSRRAEFDSLARLGNFRASRLEHLVRAASRRAQLDSLREFLSRTSPVADALRLAQQFLPPGATSVGEPPPVVFAIFGSDAYAQERGIVVDLLLVLQTPLIPMLAHEFHHAYLGRQSRVPSIGEDQTADAVLATTLLRMRNEGLADLIDKPYPLMSADPVRAAYVQRYNDEYARTPATLRIVDSLLAVAADDSTQFAAVGQRVRTLLWSGGHPNGAYVARTIYETFGRDSLFPAVYNPAAFLRTYAAAERKHGNPAPFSPKAMTVVRRLEERYWKQ
jgi:hypothetical protein